MSICEGEKEEGTSTCFDVVLVLESLFFGEDDSGERGHVYCGDRGSFGLLSRMT